MTETLTYGYSSENTQLELYNEYQHDSLDDFQQSLRPFNSDESSLSIRRVKETAFQVLFYFFCCRVVNVNYSFFVDFDTTHLAFKMHIIALAYSMTFC